MDSSNHWYGHAHVFARYCGIEDERPPRIHGVLQHGWTFVHGYGSGHAPPFGFPKFIWSDASRRRGQAYGWRDYVVTGSPWAYLLQMAAPAPPWDERAGTIFYPFHGWEFDPVDGSHEALIEEIRDTEDGPVTACLYWVEHDDPRVRSLYEDAGFRVICHGRRGWKWQGTEPEFLWRQHAELVRHRRVASNRLTTALFYGASVGCDVAVYGDPMEFRGDNPGFADGGRTRRMLPEMFGRRTDREAVQAIVHTELGLDHVTTPEEIRMLFGWERA
ncbi:hypothetical protein [Solicola sp. PLA-1-18]|uniref:hypothetical protein n=1 Tax=Solicola sp. PLA-1-18 TaxID=3380532 RepID=UPI003B7FC335